MREHLYEHCRRLALQTDQLDERCARANLYRLDSRKRLQREAAASDNAYRVAQHYLSQEARP